MSQGNPYGDNPYSPPTGGAMKPPGFPQGGPPMGPPPKNYLVESILLLICCGGLFAIPAIVFAAQVNGKHQAGDFRGAQEASDNAKKWCLIALCIGLLCNAILGGLQVFAIMAEGGL